MCINGGLCVDAWTFTVVFVHLGLDRDAEFWVGVYGMPVSNVQKGTVRVTDEVMRRFVGAAVCIISLPDGVPLRHRGIVPRIGGWESSAEAHIESQYLRNPATR